MNNWIKDLKGRNWIDWIKIIVALDIVSVGIGLIIGIDFHVLANLFGFITRILFGILYILVAVLILKRVFPSVLHVDGNDDIEKGNINSDIKKGLALFMKFIRRLIKKIIRFADKLIDRIDEKLDDLEYFFHKRKEEIKKEIKVITDDSYMSSKDIRNRFLEFFKERDHVVLESASLVTTDVAGETNTTLFNTAGMQPLIPYLMGKNHEKGKRLVSSQKCVRTVDIDEVGDNTHATFFEMLGNWSLGDYFKEESIKWSWDFLTDKKVGLGLDPKRIFVTVFKGGMIDGKEVGIDKVSVSIWNKIFEGVDMDPSKRIFYKLEDNWWSAGDNSPCGTTTEIFYDLSGDFLKGLDQDEFEKFEEKQQIVEIWNNVFMEYIKENGVVVGDLADKNVDTGAGLERLAAVMQHVSSISETDLFKPILEIIEEKSKDFSEHEARIVADHIKTSVFMIFDGVKASNTGRGYVLRRMIRRSVDNMNLLGFDVKDTSLLIKIVISIYKGVYDLASRKEDLYGVIEAEIDKYIKTIREGERELSKLSKRKDFNLDGKTIAYLEQTYGLPFDITKKIASDMHIEISSDSILEYKRLKKEHQEKSRLAGESKFKGGLAGDSPKVVALHTVTHLMLAGLRKFLGDSVYQRGSNITEKRARFDFTYKEKVSKDILEKVEDYVNNAIASGAIVSVDEMNKEDAKKSDVVGSFWEKYPDKVKVYSITGDNDEIYSKELCGGPHVEKLSDISKFGKFKIIKESSSSAGVRRIKAVLEK